MRVNQIDPIHTPELFHPAFDTGEIDGESNPIYTYDSPHLEDIVAAGKKLRKKAKDNHEQSCHLKDDSSVDVYYDDQLVATWQIIPQYWQNEWKDYTKTPTALEVTPEGRLQCSGDQGGFSWDVDIGWTRGDSKWTIHVVAPGILFRFKWQVTFTTLGQQLIADETLKLGHEDYLGDIEDDLGVVERNVIFEPLGVNDELIVDPYLSVDEQSTTVNIKTDAAPFFEIEFDEAKGGVIDTWYQGDGGSINYAHSTNGLLSFSLREGVSTYRRQYLAFNATLTILENTPTRVRIKVQGQLSDVSGRDYVIYYTIYASGHIFIDYTFTNTSGSGLSVERSMYAIITTDSTNYASESRFADNSNDSTPTYGSENWFGQYAPTLKSVLFALMDIDNSKAYQNAYYEAANVCQYYNSITQTRNDDESYSIKAVLYIGGTDDTETEVETALDQYINIASNVNLIDIVDSIGSFVTDLNIPKTIDASEAMASDGAYQIDLNFTNHNAKLDFNQTETNPAVVLHEASIRTGDGTTEHLVGHWKCDDNAASTTIVDETGNYNGSLIGGDNTEDISSTDAIRNRSLLTNGVDDSFDLSSSIAGITDLDKFTLIIKAKPNFNYDVGTDEQLFRIRYDASNRVVILYDSTNDSWQLMTDMNGTSYDSYGSAFTNNDFLQQYYTFHLCFDLTNDLIILIVNSEVIAVQRVTQEWASDPTTIAIGLDAGSYGAYYIDEIKLYDDCILPYGILIPANVESDYSDAHSDILSYVYGDTLEISAESGSPSLTLGGATTATGPDGVSDSGLQILQSGNDAPYFDCSDGNGIEIDDCQISFWYENNGGILAAWDIFCSIDGSSDSVFSIMMGGNLNSLALKIDDDFDTTVSTPFMNDGTPHHIIIEWDEGTPNWRFRFDGVWYYETAGQNWPNPNTSNTTMYIGNLNGTRCCEGIMSGFTIARKGTPQLPFVLGHGPIVVPKLYKNDTISQPGTGHQIVWVP